MSYWLHITTCTSDFFSNELQQICSGLAGDFDCFSWSSDSPFLLYLKSLSSYWNFCLNAPFEVWFPTRGFQLPICILMRISLFAHDKIFVTVYFDVYYGLICVTKWLISVVSLKFSSKMIRVGSWNTVFVILIKEIQETQITPENNSIFAQPKHLRCIYLDYALLK